MRKVDGNPEAHLQLALDLTFINDAVGLSSKLAGALARVEIGTPLVLSAGLDAVGEIRRVVGGAAIVVADVKICDAGEKIARRAFEAGADIVTVVAAAVDDATWQGVLKAASEAKRMENSPAPVLLDTIGLHGEPARLEKLGAVAQEGGVLVELCIHRPKKGSPGFAELKAPYAKVLRFFDQAIVAGKLNPQEVEPALEAEFETLIVGGAVAEASDPALIWSAFRANVASFQKKRAST